MDNQPVFNKYKAVTFMCSSFPKIEDQCKQAMKEAIEKAFDLNALFRREIITSSEN